MTERHPLHVCIRETIERWNDHAEVMHMGHKIDLAALLTNAVLAYLRVHGEIGEKS